MELEPRLIDVVVPERPAGVTLLLHGGASRRSSMMVSPAQLSVLRMIPIARRVAALGHGRLAVFRLLNSRRGWDAHHTPVQDVRWALDRVAERMGRPLPTCLIGHSLGGRAAILAAGRREVRGAVALAPWVYPSDVPGGLAGKRLLIIHGTEDRIASPDRSAALARRLSVQTNVGYISIQGAKHAMIRRHRLFDGLAAQFASVTLLDTAPDGTLARLEAGETWIQVI